MSEPVTPAEARTQCSIDGTDQDAHLERLISQARGWVEDFTGRLLVRQLYTRTFDRFDSSLRILGGPVIEVTDISYLDSDGVEQEWPESSFRAIIGGQETRIEPAIGDSWPSAACARGVITVTFMGGYEPEDVPPALKAAMLLLIGELYGNRESLSEATLNAATNICWPHRVMVC